MPSFDAQSAEIHVFTHKAGLLSRVAHDLRLRVNDFTLEVERRDDGYRIDLRVDPHSLRVECAMKNGRDDPRALSDKDKRDILKNIDDDVLQPRRFPELGFVAEGTSDAAAGGEIVGELQLHGKRRTVRARKTREGSHWLAEVRFDQREFGIKPFSAMLGSLKIEPEVLVQVRVPVF